MTQQAQFIETIIAPATPPGKGGVAIIRVSGPLVSSVITNVLKRALTPRMAAHSIFYSEHGEAIDEGIAIYFPAPNSFTGEDVLELHAHGGPVIVDLLLERLLNLNTRLARPGEFSERAFLNNKIDLTQAEAIADLIDASSRKAARLAVRTLQGDLAKKINVIAERMIHLRMYVEAAIDFAEEEIDFLADEKIRQSCNEILQELMALQNQAMQGSKLREGIKAVIAGAPNVGKSSLLNCLSEQEFAIVTDIPGTTRDVLRNQILIDGIPLHIVDTAGLRETTDPVEQEGVKRAYQEMQTADLILHVSDATSAQGNCYLPQGVGGVKIIHILNKIDLTDQAPGVKKIEDKEFIYLSVHTKTGIDALKQSIKKCVGLDENNEGIYLARRRHLDAILRAYKSMTTCQTQLLNNKNGELAAEDLREAHKALCEITGEFSTEDLLGVIFANFCIGK